MMKKYCFLFLIIIPLFCKGQNTISPSNAIKGIHTGAYGIFISGTENDFNVSYSSEGVYVDCSLKLWHTTASSNDSGVTNINQSISI